MVRKRRDDQQQQTTIAGEDRKTKGRHSVPYAVKDKRVRYNTMMVDNIMLLVGSRWRTAAEDTIRTGVCRTPKKRATNLIGKLYLISVA